MKYPYSPGLITTQQAVEFIAKAIDPGHVSWTKDDRTRALKRVRSTIDYGRKKGEVSRSDPMGAGDFFKWACRQKDWGELEKVDGLPRAPIVAHMTGFATVRFGTPIGVVMPNDLEACKAELRRLALENAALKIEAEEQVARAAELETEVAVLRQEKAARCQTNRDNARKNPGPGKAR